MIYSTSKLTINMKKIDIKYLSHKIIRKDKNKGLDGENHFVVVCEPQKSNLKKDISKGESLFEAPEDEVLGILPSYF